MLRKQWQDYALKAKQIAKHIVTGLEQDKNGVRLIQRVYGLLSRGLYAVHSACC